VRRFLNVNGGVASIADLNGDGVSEVVEYAFNPLNPNQSGIKVTAIQGDGSLGSAQFYPEPYDRVDPCIAWNGDPGQCTITHDANGEYIDGGINAFVVGDVNHDGRDDIINDRTRTKMVYVNGVLDTRGAPQTTVLQVRTLGPGGVLPIPGRSITGWSPPTFVSFFRLVDFNGDGHLDIFAPTPELDGHVNQILLNDGAGNFRGIPGAYIPQITPYPGWHNYFSAEPIDANSDGIMDLVLRLQWVEPSVFPVLPTASAVTYLATKRFFTGLAYANPALRGVPGFNDDYYLNAHPTVRTLIAQHTYTDALDHYLKAGKALGWQPFALGTTVYGSDGPDFVRLRGGNETAVGSPGRDFYLGGTGRDTFVFNKLTDTGSTLQTRDVIMDFAPHTDKIDLHGIDAKTTVVGNQAFTFLPVANTIFHHIAGEQRWRLENPINTVNDKTIIEGDTNGDGIADLQIELRGLMNVFAGDLVL
jgi:Ca2+-binding RTX toxin-like protein